jgi:DNA-binding NarL/FixJ family response regulator
VNVANHAAGTPPPDELLPENVYEEFAARVCQGLKAAVMAVYAAGRRDERSALRASIARITDTTTGALLSPRELQVLRHMAYGKSNAEIAGALGVVPSTVKAHSQRLFRKLGARDRAEAVGLGYRLGIIEVAPSCERPNPRRK